MKKTYTKKQIQEAIAYWEKQLASGDYRKITESAGNSVDIGDNLGYTLFPTSLDQLAESGSDKPLDEADPINIDYIALENTSSLGRVAFGLLNRLIVKHASPFIKSA